jgi:tetratricopeptide (TPR) repeat protein
VYSNVSGHAFLDYDDGEYVYENPNVLAGLTPGGMAWAFTTGHAANWHPLTWLSHMADVSLFGPSPRAHHVVNVVFHAANSVLVFLVLNVLAGALWRSAIVAALFAVHPLNVQSVAWVAERKNVLSTLFWLLGLLAYAAYARRPSKGRFALVAVCLALGLISKPMLVTFPLTLLILDFWPLRRISLEGTREESLERIRELLFEKAPLFVLVGISSVVTWAVQVHGAAVASSANFPLPDRVTNALISAALYLLDAAWPARLSMFYPHPGAVGGHVGLFPAVVALAALAGITLAAWKARESRPYVAAGWAWFAVTLIPVIGLVQVGAQSRADRYTYVPMLGVFTAVVWLSGDLASKAGRSASVLAFSAGLAAITLLGIRAHTESAYWRSPESLYERALALNPQNWLAWNNLGAVGLARGETKVALSRFENALRIHPDFSDALYNRGVSLQRLSRVPEAIANYERALTLDPGRADAWVNLGIAHARLGRPKVAIECYRRALDIRAEDPNALYGLVLELDNLGDRRGAFAALDRLRRVNPRMAAELYEPPRGSPTSR